MNEPYRILGISPDATDEEVKNAYRALARKYHPDNFANDATARELAENRMKEINEAYDQIQNMRRQGSRTYGSTGSYTNDNSSYRDQYNTIRSMLNGGNIAGAEAMLNQISEHGAEWNFLYGCVCAAKGYNFEAQNYFATACSMDPQNMEYRNALNNMRTAARGFNTAGGYNTASGSECSGCDICSSLLCADCCCECMGGDLIPCC